MCSNEPQPSATRSAAADCSFTPNPRKLGLYLVLLLKDIKATLRANSR
jgi:hypothetical protein